MRREQRCIGSMRAAVLVATAASGGLLAATAAAATTVQLTQNLPTAPLQVAVGDQIDLTLPPATPTIPSGYTGPASVKYPVPTTSDSTVLPLTSATYDSGGTEHATFQAASAGTAQIKVSGPSYSYCSTSTTTTTGTTASPAPTSCVVADPALQTAAVVVSGSGVQGVSVTTPATGTGTSSTAGLGIAIVGVMVIGAALVLLRGRLRRHR